MTPAWTGRLYGLLAVLLLPWIVYLGFALPDHTTAANWDVAWVGFDVMEFIALASTAYFAWKQSIWIELSATSAAVLLIVDAWFDCTTALGGRDLAESVILAVFIELPLAAISLWLAGHTRNLRASLTPALARAEDEARAGHQ